MRTTNLVQTDPNLDEPESWSIGVCEGENPFCVCLSNDVKNPILTADDVTDVSAAFVADPFVVRQGNAWYMFFEVMNSRRGNGEIALATSCDGLRWKYERVVLREDFHLSYPHIIRQVGRYFMIPETHEADGVFLYEPEEFPLRWKKSRRLISGRFVDATVLKKGADWWMFACSTPQSHDQLVLYHARSLFGPWAPHCASPIVSNNVCAARPAGRLIHYKGKLIRYAQDCEKRYGSSVRAFFVNRLSQTVYEEQALDGCVLSGSGRGWNASCMHHFDPHLISHERWRVYVDGRP